MFKKRNKLIKDVKIPQHIAIIMDGNGRWAQKKGLNRKFGHAAGGNAFRNIVDYCIKIDIKYLTIYAFSTENWKRPEEEVLSLMKLLDEYLDEMLVKLAKYDAKIIFIGDKSKFSVDAIKKMQMIEEKSQNKKLVLNMAINYGGRDEITHAVNKILEKNRGEKITTDMINANLYTKFSPDPDLIIRTAGDFRLSNFLLWQAAYSEFYFTDTLWPDFDENALNLAINEYSNRKRRFGGL